MAKRLYALKVKREELGRAEEQVSKKYTTLFSGWVSSNSHLTYLQVFASVLSLAKFTLGFHGLIQIFLRIRVLNIWAKDLGLPEGSHAVAGAASGRYCPASLSHRPPPKRVNLAGICWSACLMHGPDRLSYLTPPGSPKRAAGQ